MAIESTFEDVALKTIVEDKNGVGEEDPKSNAEGKVDFDDLLSAAGEFGPYQVMLFLATFPFYMFGVFVYYSQLFITEASPNHWCWIPELENLTAFQRRALAIPPENNRFGYSSCLQYDVDWTDVLLNNKSNGTWKISGCLNGWEYNTTEIPYATITSDLEWVCDKDSYQATAQSLFFVGSVVGGFIFGWVSDQHGRLPAIIFSNLVGCAGGAISAYASNFTEFVVCRFVMGMAYDNCMMMAFLLVLEYVAPKYRTILSSLSFALFYALGVTTIPWIAKLCGHWKTFALVTSLPLALAVFSPLLLPESPRWFLSKGRTEDAITRVLSISNRNKKKIPYRLIENFRSTVKNSDREKNKSVVEILRRPLLRWTFIFMCIEYMCCSLVFDALVRSIGQLDFDFFVSFSVISFTEFPSMLLVAFVMDHIGRRWLSSITLIISCVFSLLTVYIGEGLASVSCALVARFAVNMSYSAAMQWVAEMLPTSVRGSGASTAHICGYVGTIISPYIIYLEVYMYWLPLVIVACIAAVGATLALVLPETAEREMPHTFEDAEELKRTQRFWEFPFMNKSRRNNAITQQVNGGFEQ